MCSISSSKLARAAANVSSNAAVISRSVRRISFCSSSSA